MADLLTNVSSGSVLDDFEDALREADESMRLHKARLRPAFDRLLGRRASRPELPSAAPEDPTPDEPTPARPRLRSRPSIPSAASR